MNSLKEMKSHSHTADADQSDGGRRPKASIRVLCAQRDAIGKIGGGEAAGARLLGRAVDAVVTWPVSRKPPGELPSNFEAAMVDMDFRAALRDQVRALPPELRSKDCEDFYEAISLAHTVRGRTFDVVECPDYLTFGRFLPFAFAEYGVRYERLVCSLHGRLSRTFEIENQFYEVIQQDQLERLRAAERQFVFGTADIRYGFSERYVSQTRTLAPYPVELIDPLCALPDADRSGVAEKVPQEPGKIWFIARQDRFKGADLFLSAVFRAGAHLWDSYAMCGPSVRFGNRVSVFEGMSYCRNRGMPFNYRGPLPYSEIVRQVHRTNSLVVVPSREETFNLVSLEALLNGVPTLISRHAGAADFIRARLGEDIAAALEFDPLDELASADVVREAWGRLEEYRGLVRRALERADLAPRPDTLIQAYRSEPSSDSRLRDEAFRAWEKLLSNLFIRQTLPQEASSTRPSGDWSYLDVGETQTGHGQQGKPHLARTARIDGSDLFKLADAVLGRPAADNRLVALHQARRLASLSPHVNRGRLYRYLADCEEPSRPHVAAAYRLRAFRMGALTAGQTAELARQLHELGAVEEEVCLRLWSSNPTSGSDEQISRYLENRRQRLLDVNLEPCEYVIDRRIAGKTPRVSVIVSMYNAPLPVLRHFMAHLSRVSMVKDHRAEVIFIDSGSPQRQQELLEGLPSTKDLSYVLVRSRERETIQTAWNRGIRMSAGEYITCLGVDEGVTEFALDELSRFLDEHRDVDWVTANTVITNVDEEGRWKRDVMTYSRPTYSRFSYFNDCTYINYVGGLYRRSIHRFGLYDGAFRGAGDTEFKCRIFPYIRTAALPKTLGFYFDYPASRVTNSANIEVEDLRAWYVFRTKGGIEHLMGQMEAPEWEELFWTALSGRRCWGKTPSDCDLTFAGNVLAGLLKREPAHPLRSLSRPLAALTREMRLLQDWSGRRPWFGSIAEKDLIERSAAFFRKCSRMKPDLNFPPDFRSDASFFAHSWTW